MILTSLIISVRSQLSPAVSTGHQPLVHTVDGWRSQASSEESELDQLVTGGSWPVKYRPHTRQRVRLVGEVDAALGLKIPGPRPS